jgi:hypothetical protein
MIAFTEAQRDVYCPEDRRLRIWIRPSGLLLLIVLALVPFILARLQVAWRGLPYIASAQSGFRCARSERSTRICGLDEASSDRWARISYKRPTVAISIARLPQHKARVSGRG